MKTIFKYLAITISSVIVVFACQLSACKKQSDDKQITYQLVCLSDTSTYYDTIEVLDTHKVKIPVIVPVPVIIDSSKHIAVYADSTTNNDISIYWADTVQGFLLGKHIEYKLHVPKEIIKTITNTQIITQFQKYNYQLYGVATLGNNDARIGMLYLREKYMFGYDYNLRSNSHNATIGYRLWAK